MVVVVQTLGYKRAGGELSGCGIGRRRRLNGMVRPPVVTGWAELVTV